MIWVGTGNGLVQLTRDGGKSWTRRHAAELAAGRDQHHRRRDITTAGTAYVALLSRDSHPHFYRTADFGDALAGDRRRHCR